MKKMLVLFGVIISFFIVLTVIINENEDKQYENEITTKELEQEVLEENDHFVYFYQTDCIYCKETTPIVIPMANELNINLKVLNLQEDIEGWKKFGIEGTPSIVRFKNGREVDRIVGKNTEGDFREWFESNK